MRGEGIGEEIREIPGPKKLYHIMIIEVKIFKKAHLSLPKLEPA